MKGRCVRPEAFTRTMREDFEMNSKDLGMHGTPSSALLLTNQCLIVLKAKIKRNIDQCKIDR